MFYAMYFTGTRAAYVLPVAGFTFYAVVSGRRKALVTLAVFRVLGFGFINMPTSNPNIIRFQSAFSPGDDASYKVRERNQAMIQPFIQSHPMGGGMGSVGVWGQRFSPGTFLADFPPDSGFVRVAVEMGWFGLLLYCTMLFVFFHEGLKNHFQLKTPELKKYSLALLASLFMMVLANFPQEALGQMPNNLLFFFILAALSKIKTIENLEHNAHELAKA